MASVDSFMSFHEGWFEDPDWTMETEILVYGVHATSLRETKSPGKPVLAALIVVPPRSRKPEK